jgi:hypothetical protein
MPNPDGSLTPQEQAWMNDPKNAYTIVKWQSVNDPGSMTDKDWDKLIGGASSTDERIKAESLRQAVATGKAQGQSATAINQAIAQGGGQQFQQDLTAATGAQDAAAAQQALASGDIGAGEAAVGDYQKFAAGAQAGLEPSEQNAEDVAAQQRAEATQLWNQPGYTDAEKQGITAATMTPIAGTYTAAQEDIRNQAARTGNAGAYGSMISDLARQKSRDLALAGAGLQSNFAQQRIAGQEFANQALGGAAGSTLGAGGLRQSGTSLVGGLQQATPGLYGQAGAGRLGAGEGSLQTAGSKLASAGTSLMPVTNIALPYYGAGTAGLSGATGPQTGLSQKPNPILQGISAFAGLAPRATYAIK